MEFERAVVQAGTEAVLRYRSMAGAQLDNDVPRSFLRSFIAERLHERLELQVHVDRLFSTMALELGMPLEKELVGFLGGYQSDVASMREENRRASCNLTFLTQLRTSHPAVRHLTELTFLPERKSCKLVSA